MIEIIARTPDMLPGTWHVMAEVHSGSDPLAVLDAQAHADVAAGAPVGSLWEAREMRGVSSTTLATRRLEAEGVASV